MSIRFDKLIVQNQIWAISLFTIAWSLKPFSKTKWLEIVSTCNCAHNIDTSIFSGNYHNVLDIIFGTAVLGFVIGLACSKGYHTWIKVAVSFLWIVLFVVTNPIFR